MAISANTLAETASSLMDQLKNNTITFQSYRDSMNSIAVSSEGNEDFKDANNDVAIHTIDVAQRIAGGEAPPTGKPGR